MEVRERRRGYRSAVPIQPERLGRDGRNIVLHELIGLGVNVVNSSDPKQIGIEGKVRYETKNMLEIATKEGIKKVAKKISTFKFIAGKDSYTVSGEEICFRPHERIEKSQKFCKKRS